MAISPNGIQLLSDPNVLSILYKNTREPAWRAAGVLPPTAIVDRSVAGSGGTAYDLGSPESLHFCNGPLGKAGWDDAAPADLLFARRFFSSLTTAVESAAVIDAAVPLACADEHTLQVAFKWEWDFSSTRGIHATANNAPGAGVGNDFINRISGNTAAQLITFTENNDTNVAGVSTAGAIRAGFWQLATFVYRIASASTFDCRIFVHTRENDGSVTGIGGDPLGFDVQVPTQRCNVASGLTDGRIDYGRLDFGSNDFIGDIYLGRVVKEALSDVDVDAQARAFLTAGILSDYGTNELYRHEFGKDRPELVDEGPMGLHVYSVGDVIGGNDPGVLDVVGTSGKIIRATRTGTTRYVSRTFPAPQTLQNLLGSGQLTRLNDLFNDDLAAIPEWTWMGIGSPQSFAASMPVVQFNQAGGESLASNHVVNATLDFSNGNIGYFAERGNGTNIAGLAQVGSLSIDPTETIGVRLYTLRYGDNPANPGTPILRVSEDANIDVVTRETNGIPQGGDSNTGLSLPWASSGFFQEFALFSRQLTDQEIIDTFALVNTGGGGGGDAPIITNLTPANGTTIARDQVISFNVEDASPGIAKLVITMKYTDPSQARPAEVLTVFEDGAFQYPFDTAESTVSGDENNFAFTVRPRGGWARTIERWRVHAVDGGGAVTDP